MGVRGAARGHEGAPCDIDHDCRTGLRCTGVGGTCVPLSPAGAPCGVSTVPTCLGRCWDREGDDGVCIDFCDGDGEEPPLGPECCTDLFDDDADGFTDCEDLECAADPGCAPCRPGRELCWDGCDNDHDCRTDTEDPDCWPVADRCGTVHCPAGPEICGGGCDEDRDFAVDCADPDCAAASACVRCPGTPEDEAHRNCMNRIDDDCDGQSDAGCDPGCYPLGDPAERCDDGYDNDLDGLRDCSDADCLCDVICLGIMPEDCDDGLDNDADTLIDAADWDCPLEC